MRPTSGRVLKILGWGTPLVLLAGMLVQRIVLGPACFQIDCTGSDATQLASDVFAWLLIGLLAWLALVIVYWTAKLLVWVVRAIRRRSDVRRL